MDRGELAAGMHGAVNRVHESLASAWEHANKAGRVALTVVALGAAGGVAYGADALIEGGGNNHAAATAKLSTGETNDPTKEASGCSSLAGDKVQTTPPSLFGQMYKQEAAGVQVPYSTTAASDQIMAEACNSRLDLAIADTLYSIYDSQEQVPDNLAQDIQSNYNSLTPGSEEAKTAENDILNFANILTVTTKKEPFVIDKGTEEIVATATGFAIEPANLPSGEADGYRIASNNLVNGSIEQQRFTNLGNIFLWTTDGTILINETVQNAVINETNIPEGSPSTTPPKNSSSESTKPAPSSEPQPGNSSSSSSTSETTQSNQGGGTGNSSGKANGNQSGNQGTGKKGITGGGNNKEGKPGSNKPTPGAPTKPSKPAPKPKPTATTVPTETTTPTTIPPTTTTPTTIPPTTTTPTTTPPTTTTPTTTPPTTTTVPTKSGNGTPGNSGGTDPGTGGLGNPFGG